MELTTTQANSPTALQGLNRLTIPRQLGMMVVLAGAVALGVWVALWSRSPGFSLLYAALDGRESAEVAQALKGAGIQYQIDADTGTVLVEAGRLQEAKLKLAEDGLPRSTDRGLEMLHDEQGFGTSQFVERKRYQRAMEVELARTISSLKNVRTARIHLNLPRQSAFVRKRKRPSASVLLDMHSGRRLHSDQVTAISNLVAAAVEDLEAPDVRIVDNQGRLLTATAGNDPLATSDRLIAYRRKLEADFVRRIENILIPIMGMDGVKAQVTVDTDTTRLEQTRESYNPDLPALRSEQSSEEQSVGDAAGGVPGALSNQPPGAGTAPEQAAGGGTAAAGAAAQNAPGSSSKRSTKNYELDRTISHTRVPAGTIRRVSAAVIVDNMPYLDTDGDFQQRPLTPEELSRLTGLVKEAIGFDAERGDTVNLINNVFARPVPPAPLPEVPIWEQTWVWDIARQAGGALFVLILVFAVLRPAMRNLVARDAAEREALVVENQERLALEGATGGEGADGTLTHSGDTHALGDNQDQEGKVKAVRELVGQDPMRVANVVKNWVKEGE